MNPDGTYTDADRARRRGLTLGKQGPDGMSQLRGWLTPEARAVNGDGPYVFSRAAVIAYRDAREAQAA